MASRASAKIGVAAAASVALAVGLSAMQIETRDRPTQVGSVNATAGDVWARHTADSPARVDHAPWTAFLQGTTVEERGVTRVAFSALPGERRRRLDAYIDGMTGLKPGEWNRNEQLAYWLNLHNALTVRIIADAGGRGTVDRLRQFPIATQGPFAARTITVEGTALSVDAIVNEVLRPNFADQPFHYGLFTGATGAPRLRRTAYDGATVGLALDEQARGFVNGHGVRVSRRELQLSSLYDWYAADFGGSDAAILRHVSAYADDRLKAGLQARATIDGYGYDLEVALVTPRRVEPSGRPGIGSQGRPDNGGFRSPVGGGS